MFRRMYHLQAPIRCSESLRRRYRRGGSMEAIGSGRWHGHILRPVAEESLPLRLDQSLRRLLTPDNPPAERQLRTIAWTLPYQPPVICELWGVWTATGHTAMRLVYPIATTTICETIAVEFVSKRL